MNEPALQNFIDGKYVDSAGSAATPLIDPCTGQAWGEAPISGPEDVDTAMRAARAAFTHWRTVTPAERQRILLAIAAELEQRIDEFAAAEARDTGSAAAAGEVPLMVDQIRFFAGAARVLEGRSAGEYAPEHTSYVRREPVGVCAQLAPWNFPLLMAVLKSVPAIAAGNTVVLKPAPTTPSTALYFAELAARHLPSGVLNVLCGDETTGHLLVRHDTPAMVSITGSVEAGMDVAAAAAATVKQVHLELGGKTPVIVCRDADLSAATEKIIAGAFGNAGQDCTAASLVLADEAIYDDLLAALVAAAQRSRPGPPSDDGASYGPLNNAAQLDRISGLIERLPTHARVLTGGRRVGDEGFYFAPTVIAGVRPDDEIARIEIFGPVLTMQTFRTEDEAVALANGLHQGLASALWTRDNARAMRLSAQLDFGCVWVNTHLGFPSEMPHGGFKHSGYGKDLSVYGFEAYTRLKHVMHHIGA